MLACAAVPIANDEGSTGSAPGNVTVSSAASGWPARRHSAASASVELVRVLMTRRVYRRAGARASARDCR